MAASPESRDGARGRCYVAAMPSSQVLEEIRALVRERDWDQFHAPANLAASIAIEAGELLEHYQWTTTADTDEVAGELADVLTYCYLLADKLGLDADEIVLAKLETSRAKYPVEKARGVSTKYDRL